MADAPVPLRLPHNRHTTIRGNPADRSIVEPLRATGGDWEPHLRALWERLVEPEWVCLDIGANIGVHTLALASLATAGAVAAFEPGPANYRHLTRNLQMIEQPHATIDAIEAALWHEAATLRFLEFPELAGCSYPVSPQTRTGEGGIERLVQALPLDDWWATAGFKRLDLIKLDAEGTEPQVLTGAAATLAQHRPLLVTEFNPSALAQVSGIEASSYEQALRRSYRTLRLVEPDGSLSAPLDPPDELARRVEEGKGWEDLLCEP